VETRLDGRPPGNDPNTAPYRRFGYIGHTGTVTATRDRAEIVALACQIHAEWCGNTGWPDEPCALDESDPEDRYLPEDYIEAARRYALSQIDGSGTSGTLAP
jgi:hypothetical protein